MTQAALHRMRQVCAGTGIQTREIVRSSQSCSRWSPASPIRSQTIRHGAHRSHEFEALERTFNLAAPLIHVDPEISINGIKLRDYYCHHFYNAMTPGHANSLPMPEDLPDATYQFTCEFGGLTKTMLLMPDVLWPHLTQQQRDEMAAYDFQMGASPHDAEQLAAVQHLRAFVPEKERIPDR